MIGINNLIPMLDILKQDAKINDVIRLYLTSGETIVGVLSEFGDNNIVLDVEGKKRRFFTQIIGGWDVQTEQSKHDNLPMLSELSLDNMKSVSTEEISDNPKKSDDKKAETANPFKSFIAEKEKLINSLLNKFEESLSQEEKEKRIESNAEVVEVKPHTIFVSTPQNKRLGIPIKNIGDYRLYQMIQSFKSGQELPVFIHVYRDKDSQKEVPNSVLLPGSITDFISLIKHLIFEERNIIQAKNVCYSIIENLPNNRGLNAIIKELSSLSSNLTPRIVLSIKNTQLSVINQYIEEGDFFSAVSTINSLLDQDLSYKDRTKLMSNKGQLLTSLGRSSEAIETYLELLFMLEEHKANDKVLSRINTELVKLYVTINEKDRAVSTLSMALSLDPKNKEAKALIKRIGKKKFEVKDTNVITNALSFEDIDESLIEHDIDEYVFVDSEIVALKGNPNQSVASRILETANDTNNMYLYLEAAKAYKSLPSNSYDYQDYNEAVEKYSYLKCSTLYSSFSAIFREALKSGNISVDQLERIKDCAYCYHAEAFAYSLNSDRTRCGTLMLNCVRMDVCTHLIKEKTNPEELQTIFGMSLVEILDYCESTNNFKLLSYFADAFVSISTLNNDIWAKYLNNNEIVQRTEYIIKSDTNFYQSFTKFEGCHHISQDVPHLLEGVISWKTKHTHKNVLKLLDMANSKFDVFTLSSISRKCENIVPLNMLFTDAVSLRNISNLIKILKLYPVRNSEERKIILNNALHEIENQIKWNTGDATKLGRLLYAPLLLRWKGKVDSLTEVNENIKACAISVALDPPYYLVDKDGKRHFNFVVNNISNITIEGFRVAIFTNNKRNAIVVNEKSYELQPKETKAYSFEIPEKWGIHNLYELNIVFSSLYMTKWSIDGTTGYTLSKQPDVKLRSKELKWAEKGTPLPEMFKGRDGIVTQLVSHYISEDRHQTYVLYGLSRTGKSSILEYLKKNISKKILTKENEHYKILPIIVDLAAIMGVSMTSESFWNNLLNTLEEQRMIFIKERPLLLSEKVIPPENFTSFTQSLAVQHLYPLIMFDEFSYMKDAIDHGFVNSAFLQLMRNLSAEKDLVSFIYAGTYDIKQLIHNPDYNISGSSIYLIEPPQPIFEIPYNDAEELINAMGDKLPFTKPAVKEIHKLSGDVPFWIQKICLNCGRYAIENKIPVIGLYELESVVKILTGESMSYNRDSFVKPMSPSTFEKTQTLPSDSIEIKMLLTSIAYYLTNEDHLDNGVSYEQLQDFWDEKHFDSSKYNFADAFQALLERNTLIKDKVEGRHYYRFSIDLFRRWWAQKNDDLSIQLS